MSPAHGIDEHRRIHAKHARAGSRMKEKVPVVLTLAALGIALALGLWLRFSIVHSTGSEPSRSAAAAPETSRSVRVEERLQMLRESYARRQQLAAASQGAAAEAGGAAAAAASTASGGSKEHKPTMGAAAHVAWRVHGTSAAAAPQVATSAPAAGTRPRFVGLYGAIQPPAWMSKNTSVDELEETVLHGTDNAKRVEAIDELTLKEPEDAERILVGALLDEQLDPQVCVRVLDALGDFVEDISPAIVAPVLHHQSAEVRFEAVALLGDMDSAAARAAVQDAVSDPDPDVSELARGILDIGG